MWTSVSPCLLVAVVVDDAVGSRPPGADTRQLLSSTWAVLVAENTEITQRVPHKVYTSSRKVDECTCKPLLTAR